MTTWKEDTIIALENLGGKAHRSEIFEEVKKIRTDGLKPTVEAVFRKLAQPLPLGYCNAGEVIAVGKGVKEFKVGKDWKEYVLNIEDFVGYSNSRTFNKSINPKKIKLLGIEAYGRDHKVELDIAKIKIF